MSLVLNELVALLSLETIEENLFRGVSQEYTTGDGDPEGQADLYLQRLLSVR